MHPRIAAALGDLETTFGGYRVTHTELADGSVWVTIADVDFGAGWTPRAGDLSVKLAPTFPDTGPYPWYLPVGMCREDGSVLDRINPVTIDGINRAQLSVNAPWLPSDSLGARVVGVLHWLRVRGQARAS
jgi:hypothetical protein